MLCLTASAKAPPFHSDAKYVQLFLYKIVIQKPWAFEMLKAWSPLQIGRLWPLTWTIGRNDLCWSISVKESRTSVPASLSSSPAVSIWFTSLWNDASPLTSQRLRQTGATEITAVLSQGNRRWLRSVRVCVRPRTCWPMQTRAPKKLKPTHMSLDS